MQIYFHMVYLRAVQEEAQAEAASPFVAPIERPQFPGSSATSH